ncbi:MAG: PAS domain-containing protein [Deltaproteobacteria bacterium]|nr:PAS domain-containing protein [Deltaproteobacteria bacterium]
MSDRAILVTYYADPPFFTIKFVNQEYCELFNVKPEQVVGRSCLERAPAEHRDQVQKKIEDCIENDTILVSIEPAIKSRGTTFLIRWVDAPVKDKTGKIIELIAVGHSTFRFGEKKQAKGKRHRKPE